MIACGQIVFGNCSLASTATRRGFSDSSESWAILLLERRFWLWPELPARQSLNPYDYPRAFSFNPSEEQLEQLYDLVEWAWGTRDITFCDPMSGGGSIPFEALRDGLTVHANELNPVASVILKATLDYPARFGSSLVEDITSTDVCCRERSESP